jgi:hypothetical protein
VTVAVARTADVLAGADPPADPALALTEGFQTAFLVALGIAALGAVLALVLSSDRTRPRTRRSNQPAGPRPVRRPVVVIADPAAPLLALVGPLARDLERVAGRGRRDRRQREAAGVQRRQRDPQPVPSRPIRFSAGTKTSSKTVSEFSIPRRPMNALRLTMLMPSES